MTYGLRSATVRFGDTTAIHDVSLDVRPGSILALVGGDGAGKTTALRALVRKVGLDAGEVDAPSKAELGYLPASAGSWAALTVAQNMDFAAGVYGVTGRALADRRAQLLQAAGLVEAADRPASQLSGGMRRKLGFCMALVHQPSLLVLDEPSTGVDPVSRVELWRLVAEAAAAGAAVVLATTYLNEAERAADLVVLDRGQVLVQGPYDRVRAGFTGTITRSSAPVRPAWSWRRGVERHEYWPDADHPSGRTVVPADLEDIVIALSLTHRAGAGAPA